MIYVFMVLSCIHIANNYEFVHGNVDYVKSNNLNHPIMSDEYRNGIVGFTYEYNGEMISDEHITNKTGLNCNDRIFLFVNKNTNKSVDFGHIMMIFLATIISSLYVISFSITYILNILKRNNFLKAVSQH